MSGTNADEMRFDGFDPNRRWVNTDPAYWARLSKEALEDARVLLDGDRNMACCMHCHMAVERALKSLLAAEGLIDDGDNTHSLTRLANKANLKSSLAEEAWNALRSMNELHQNTAYPQSKEVWDCLNRADYATMALRDARTICKLIGARRKSLDGGGGPHGS